MIPTTAPTPRIPAIATGEVPETAALIERIKSQRGGRLLLLYQVLLNSPPVASGWLHLLTAIRQKTSLRPVLREMIILHIAVLNRAAYEFDMHAPIARELGVSDRTLELLRSGAIPDELPPCDRAALKFASEMTRNVQVREDVFAEVRGEFDDRSLLELTVTIAAYNMVSRVLQALGIESEPR